MQFIHRSVGEPAEGSLTRYPYVKPKRIVFNTSLHSRMSGFMFVKGMIGIAQAVAPLSTICV
jgi:hypothetical protein